MFYKLSNLSVIKTMIWENKKTRLSSIDPCFVPSWQLFGYLNTSTNSHIFAREAVRKPKRGHLPNQCGHENRVSWPAPDIKSQSAPVTPHFSLVERLTRQLVGLECAAGVQRSRVTHSILLYFLQSRVIIGKKTCVFYFQIKVFVACSW